MIRLAIIVAILAAGLIVGPEFMGRQGYVLVAAGNYTIETTVTVFLVGAVLFYLLLLFVEWLLGRILASAIVPAAGLSAVADARP
ncbi:hypothetical protein MBH78_07110 [Oceanimonas sp. NS1]|nr:hypothetical protein [Oceanimonas sp. NS1]